ncbi:29410_t:CDS:2, partial [Racocetra persica]
QIMEPNSSNMGRHRHRCNYKFVPARIAAIIESKEFHLHLCASDNNNRLGSKG